MFIQNCLTLIKVIVFLILTLFFFSCNNIDLQVENALNLSGNNRNELEKVLHHYTQNDKDALKLKAAKFLIANMDAHFSYKSDELDEYYKNLHAIYSINKQFEGITKEQDSLIKLLKKPHPNNFEIVPDLQIITADILIDNIDNAFKAWQSPFAENLSFEDFCEYLLPYKVDNEKPSVWRTFYEDSILKDLKFLTDTTVNTNNSLIWEYNNTLGKDYLFIPEDLLDTLPELTITFNIKPDSHENIAWFLNIFAIKPDLLPLEEWSHLSIALSTDYSIVFIDGNLINKKNKKIDRLELIENKLGEIIDLKIYSRILNTKEILTINHGIGYPKEKEDILQEIVWKIRDLYDIKIAWENTTYGGYDASFLFNIKRGICHDYSVLGNYIYRSMGIPSTIDFTLRWGDGNLGHDWNVIFTSDKQMKDYSFSASWEKIGEHVKNRREKKSKIFRETYSKQKGTPGMYKKEEIPEVFQTPCIKDVTEVYLDCMDITISLTISPPKTKKFVYLCTFDNSGWTPVHWAEVKGKKAVFTKMGKDMAYIAMYYHNGRLYPASEPFILTKEGEIKLLKVNTAKKESLILKRKFTAENMKGRGALLSGGKFQVANKKDFSDSLTIHTIEDIPEVCYNRVDINLKKPYRYFRFLAPKGSFGGNIAEIEVLEKESLNKLIGDILGNGHCFDGKGLQNVFDGDPLTYYRCHHPDWGEVGLDFYKPVFISGICYLPWNDDNFIKEREMYELFYWNNRWISMGKQIGTKNQYLKYIDVPTNTLFWLRNLTKGKEERIFIYENGEQIWW